MSEIFFHVNGQQQGPYSEVESRQLVSSGTIPRGTPAWHKGLPEWVPAEKVLDLPALAPPPRPSAPKPRAVHDICTECGHAGKSVKKTKGSFLVELGLWMMCLAAGVLAGLWVLMLVALIYSMWRVVSRESVCPVCKKPAMIPASSPRGSKMLAEIGAGLRSPAETLRR